MRKDLNYRTFLISELENRKRRNPSYSLRAFARDLNVPVSRLSEVINGKVGLSEARAIKIAEQLGLSVTDKDLFVNLVLSEHARTQVIKNLSKERVQQRMNQFEHVGEDTFKLISDWHYSAILTLLSSASNETDAEHLAKRLNLSVDLVESSLVRLEQLSFIAKKDGKWVPVGGAKSTSSSVPSEAIRSYHKQVLGKAISAIDNQSMDRRDISSMMISINKRKLLTAKRRIEEFRRNLMAELEADTDRDSVYCMSLQFFEITEI